MSAWAGFCGAIPFGLGLWYPLTMVFGGPNFGEANVGNLLRVLSCLLPLLPFVIASAWIERGDWPRVQGVIAAGLCVGGASMLLFIFAFLVVIPAAGLGLVLGLATVIPCWWRGDAAGRALALLGTAPTMLYLVMIEAEGFLRTGHVPGGSPLDDLLTERQVHYVVAFLLILAYSLIVTWAVRRNRAQSRAKPGSGWDWLD